MTGDLPQRVTRLERTVFGFKDGQTRYAGLVTRVDNIEPIIREVRVLIIWTKRVLGTFALSVVAAVGVWLVDRL